MIVMPGIVAGALSEGERAPALSVHANLQALSSSVDEFYAAVELCTWAHVQVAARRDFRETAILHKWSIMGARMGALALYEFWQGTQAINKLLGRCPTIHPWIDMGAKKRAQQLLTRQFPDLAKIRLSAAHGGELVNTPEKLNLHSVPLAMLIEGQGGTVTMLNTLVGNRLTTSIEGNLVSYEVTHASTEALAKVANGWAEAFRPVEAASMELYRAKRKGTEPPPQPNQNDRQ